MFFELRISASETFPCIAKTEQVLHATPLPWQTAFSEVHCHTANPLAHFQLHFVLAAVDFTVFRGEVTGPVLGF
jgi:hypothetical protein